MSELNYMVVEIGDIGFESDSEKMHIETYMKLNNEVIDKCEGNDLCQLTKCSY